jgi:hypothetical protein
MAATIAEAIAQAKDGIGDYLTSTAGLRAADGIVVRTATIAPEEFQQEMVILGDVTAPQGRPGLRGRSATPTMTCWVVIIRPGGGETAIRAARDRATALMGLIEGALAADPSAASTVQPPGGLQVASGGLEESPVAWDEQAARRATVPFTLSWTSHVA